MPGITLSKNKGAGSANYRELPRVIGREEVGETDRLFYENR
jgi:hypothetical protein